LTTERCGNSIVKIFQKIFSSFLKGVADMLESACNQKEGALMVTSHTEVS
jgi:hypothetical protein